MVSKKCKLTTWERYSCIIIIGGYGDFYMKLEKFKERDNKKVGILIFTVCCILLITGVYLYSSFAIYEQDQNFNVINGTVEDPGDLYFAFYVDDVISKTMPSKDSGYVLDTEKSSCTNGATPLLNMDDWSLEVQNLTTTHTKCTLYFKESTPYDECVSKYGADSIQCSIIADVDTEGCPTVNDDGMIQVTGEESENGYLCSAPDDYGTSYYYRGNVTNNYVKFGDYYWRIIRINGDGSIRIIYDGTSAHANGESSEDRQVGTSAYNFYYDNNAYVGYMYGTLGASTYEDTHANTNASTIKTYLDNWYKTNIEDKGLSSYISDTLFCNDRSVFSGTGIGTDTTYYRWYSSRDVYLTCSNQNDRFTVDDEVTGNGDLSYPIGLVTTDESYVAGANIHDNTNYYLYTGNSYFTMTPNSYSGTAYMMLINSQGDSGGIGIIGQSRGVKPVVNIKGGALSSGDGTASNPYRLSGN